MPPGVDPTFEVRTYLGSDAVPDGRRRPRAAPPSLPRTFLETTCGSTRWRTGRRGIVFRRSTPTGSPSSWVPGWVWGCRTSGRGWGSGPTPDAPSHTRPLAAGRVRSRLLLRAGPVIERPSGLEEWLTCRWGLHTRFAGATRYLTNEHEVWPLHRAEMLALDDGLVAAAGLGGVAARPPDSVLESRACGPPSGLPEPPRASAGDTPGHANRSYRRSTCVILWRAAWVDAATGNDRTEWTWASSGDEPPAPDVTRLGCGRGSCWCRSG